jgi:hypothetical protein
MRRSVLSTVVVVFAISGFAGSQVVVTSQGYATMQGAAIAPAQISPPLLTTPSVSVTALPPAQVGISNNSMQMMAVTALAAPNANVTSLSYPGFGYAPIMGYSLPAGYAFPSSNLPAAYAPNTTMGEGIDFGVGNVSSLNPTASDDQVDLVAIAMAYKSQRRTNPRVYTNDDIRRLNGTPKPNISIVPAQPETENQNIGSEAPSAQPQASATASSNAQPNNSAPDTAPLPAPATRPAFTKPSPFVSRRSQTQPR